MKRFPWDVWLLAVVVPLALGLMLLTHGFRLLRGQEIRRVQSGLLSSARGIQARSTPQRFLLLRSAGQAVATWPADCLELTPLQQLDEPLFQEIMAYQPTSGPPPADLRHRCRERFGPGFDLLEFRRHDVCPVKVNWKGEPAWMLWRIGPGPAIAGVFLYRMPPLPWRARVLLEESLRGKGVSHDGGLFVGGQATWRSNPRDPRDLRSIAPFQDGRVHEVSRSGEVGILFRINDQVTVYLHQSLPSWSRISGMNYLWLVPVFLVLVSLPLTIVFHRWLGQLSLNVRVGLLLAYVLVFPLLGTLFFTLGYLDDLAWNQRKRTLEKGREDLLAFDHGFSIEEQRSLRLFRQLSRNAFRRGKGLAQFASLIDRQMELDELCRGEIRDALNRPLLVRSELASATGREVLLRGFSDLLWDRAFPRLAARREMREGKRSATLDLLGDVFAFHSLAQEPDVLAPLYIRHEKNLFFWATQRQKPPVPAVVQFFRTFRQMVRSYLKRHLLDRRPFRIAAFQPVTGEWYGLNAPPEHLEDFAWQVAATRNPLDTRVRLEGREMLVSGVAGQRLQGIVLLALIPRDDSTGWFAGFDLAPWFLAVALGIVICTFLLMRSDLMKPLEELGEGIKALREREGNYRIPVRNRDELGELAEAFNRMLETVGDLALIAQLQKAFMPSIPSLPGNYEIRLDTRRAGNIGGDYVDILTLGDGRHAFVIGTAPGKGVAAALRVAMGKALLSMMVAEDAGVSSMVSELQELMDTQCRRGEMMPLLILVLDAESGAVEVHQGGQGLVRWTYGTRTVVEPIRSAGRPLTARGQPNLHSWMDKLVPGQSLILGTIPLDEAVRALKPLRGWPGARVLMKSILGEEGELPPGRKAATSDRSLIFLHRKRFSEGEDIS